MLRYTRRLFRLWIVAGIFLVSSGLSGAASSVLTGIEITKVGSPVVIIGKTSVRQTAEGIEVRGHVLRNSGHEDTTRSHLVVKLYDTQGQEMREILVKFKPSQIPHRLRIPGSAQFKLVIAPLPKALKRIEIIAHDDPLESPSPASAPTN